MKKRYLFQLALIFCFGTIHSQECGTSAPSVKHTYPTNESSKASVSNYCIDVQFHIVRETNGTNAFAAINRTAIINDLNARYNDHNIFFNNLGTNFINNSNFVNIDNDGEAENLVAINNNQNALNYYIVETLWITPTGFIAGTALIYPPII